MTVHAQDPVLRIGLKALLRTQPGIILEGRSAVAGQRHVTVVGVDEPDEAALRLMREVQKTDDTSRALGVVVVTRINERQIARAARYGFGCMVRRSEATPDVLAQVVRLAATGTRRVPYDLAEAVSRHATAASRLSDVETEVLRLASEGLTSTEIAAKVSRTEWGVKQILGRITTRLRLRNRTQAVAWAVRQGLI